MTTQEVTDFSLVQGSPHPIIKYMQVAKDDGKVRHETEVIEYNEFADWMKLHPHPEIQHRYENCIEEMIGCHSDNTKFCGKCIKDMENRLIRVFENKFRTSSDRQVTNIHDILRFMYRVVGQIEIVNNGQKFLYEKWNECIVYDIYHHPVFVEDEPIYRKGTTYQKYVTNIHGDEVAQYKYAEQGYWMFNINPSAKGLDNPKILQVNP